MVFMIDKEKRPKRKKKRHPAKAARRVALLASFTATGGIGAAMAYSDQESDAETAAPAAPVALGSETAVERTTSAAQPTLNSELETAQDVVSSIVGPPAPLLSAGYQDGSWLGDAEFTKWGDVQVQVVIEGGEITDIVVVQIPNDRKSASINNVATPILQGQAISIQGADLDIVSGATYTSRNYAASLQSALDQSQLVTDGTSGATGHTQPGVTNSGSAQEIALDS